VWTIRARGVISSTGVSGRSAFVTRTVSVSTRSSSVELLSLSLVVGRLSLVVGRVYSRKEPGTDSRQGTDSERGAED
jgi:hypothetical protein